MSRAEYTRGVLKTLDFVETNCNEPTSAGRVRNIGHGKYRLPLADDILILRLGDQKLTLEAHMTRL
jgi:hypothetical protein